MRKIILLSAFLLPNILFAQNPFITNQFTADPTARVFEGKIYVYPSHDIPSPVERLKDWFCMADYHVFSSDNLSDWTDHGVIVSQDKVPWVDAESYSMWAPDCIFRNGKYYFYFPAAVKDTTLGKGSMIGVAIADHPGGPFLPQPKPIAGIHGIDPCTLIDHDGQAYIYWAGRGLWMAKLHENMTELASAPSPVQGLPEGFKEGPFVFERNGRYYFTFPWVQDKTETLAYAVSHHPMGPFDFQGLIMDQSPTGCWTNHHSIVEYNGQWYLFYHHNDLSPQFDKNRSIRMDPLFFEPDGSIRKVIPSLRGAGTTDARKKIHLDRYSGLSETGAAIDFLNKNNTFEGWKTILTKIGAWVQYDRVDFGVRPPQALNVRVYSPGGGQLAVRLDEIHGPTLADIAVPPCNGWAEIVVPLSKTPVGIHNLHVSLESGKPVEIDWINFIDPSPSSPIAFR
jgi:hypothetical protein